MAKKGSSPWWSPSPRGLIVAALPPGLTCHTQFCSLACPQGASLRRTLRPRRREHQQDGQAHSGQLAAHSFCSVNKECYHVFPGAMQHHRPFS